MPVTMIKQAEKRAYTTAEIEERKSRITAELDASEQSDKSALNNLKKFLLSFEIEHISDMNYPLRLQYENYLQDAEYPTTTIRRYLGGYDNVKQYEIAEQMKTLPGKQKYRWKYQRTIMYLLYHPDKRIAGQFRTTKQREILVWDFRQQCSEKFKSQIFDILSYLIETDMSFVLRKDRLTALQKFYHFGIRERIDDIEQLEEIHIDRFQNYLSNQGTQALKRYMPIINICRKRLFITSEKIHWNANIWYLERFHIGQERLNESSSLESISFVEIKTKKHREIVQAYMRYELGVTGQAISTITRRYRMVRNFLQYMEENNLTVLDCTAVHIKAYAKILQERKIEPKGYNERLSGIGHFFRFMVVRNYISKVNFRIEYYMQKVVTVHHDRSVEYEVYMEILRKLYNFPEHLRCMFLHLWCLGLRVSEVCMLKGDAYYSQGKDCWIQVYQVKMKTYKRIPIPIGLYKIMLVYLRRHQIQPEDYIFKNKKGGAFLFQTFRCQMLKACSENQIQNGEYIFKSHDYRHTVASMFYDGGVSIQSIRDYLGHINEEMTRQYIDYMPQKIAQANEEYFSHSENSLAGCLEKGALDGER